MTMVLRMSRIYLGVLATLLLTSTSSVWAERIFVRVEGASRTALDKLDLGAAKVASYGSFQWLEVESEKLAVLDQAGLRYRIDAQAKFVQAGLERFDPLGPMRQAAPLLPPLNASGEGLFLLQFNAPSRKEWVAELDQMGLQVLQYYPSNAYLLWGKVDAANAAKELSQVRYVGAFESRFKAQVGTPATAGTRAQLQVFFYNDGAPQAVSSALVALGAQTLELNPAQPDRRFFTATAQFDAGQLAAVYALPQVVAVTRVFDAQTEDEGANQVLARNVLEGVPQPGFQAYLGSVGLSGQGVTWAVSDSGADRDHPDLAAAYIGGWPNTNCTGQSGPGDDVGGHGSHVAGAIVGRGVGDGSGPAVEVDERGMRWGQGVAPRANLFALSFIGLPAGCPGTSDSDRIKFPLLAGAVGSNNSWNNSNSAPQINYQSSERLYDVLVRDGNFDTAAREQFSIFFSAGNAGGAGNPGTITGPHVAKNSVAVGSMVLRSGAAVNVFNNIETMVGSSSRGPAADGRLFPTISAPGGSTTSTRRAEGGSCATAIAGTTGISAAGAATPALYAPCNGTSMSTPVASGAAVLLTQWWKQFNADRNPSPAMIKALLINGARDIAGSVTANNSGFLPIPNNDEGWGQVNLRTMVDASVRGVYRDQDRVLSSTGEEVTYTVGAGSTRAPMKITLVWSDAPGAVGANPALVNDLDLEVINGGTTWLGNSFSGGVSVVGGTPDNRNNLETVLLNSPAAGPTTIRIRATALNGDALSGNGTPGSPQQDFALVCTNCQEVTFALAATDTEVGVCAAQTGSFPIQISALQGFNASTALSVTPLFSGGPGLTVNPTSVTPPAGVAVLMAAAAPGSYPFTVSANHLATTRTLSGRFVVAAAIAGTTRVRYPLASANDVGQLPTFSWYPTTGARRYQLQVASDAAFTSPLIDVVVDGLSHTPTVALPLDTGLFWRVRAINACGNSPFVAATAFNTGVPVCATAISIPDNDNSTGATSTIALSGTGLLSGLDVALEVAHTRVGDLRFVLRQVSSGRSFRLITRPNLCDGDNIAATLDDSASANVSCTASTPTLSGRLIPHDSLASLAGSAKAGDYELRAFDAASGESGTITRWCVQAATQSEIVFADGFNN